MRYNGKKKKRIKFYYKNGMEMQDARKLALKFCSNPYFNRVWINFVTEDKLKARQRIFISNTEPKEPFSTNEMDYGSNPVYKWESLGYDERVLIKSNKHKELAKL